MENYANYAGPIKIGEGIYWVGTFDRESEICCHPYLIVDEDEVVLIDAGSRSDFPTVMMKIMQVGVKPSQITTLVYQHYDPDLCGSMQNVLGLCDNPNLKILSEKNNIPFISFYLHKSSYNHLKTINDINFELPLKNRKIRFIATPYSHSRGSFVTYDEGSKILFSSDLFGSFLNTNKLFQEIEEECYECLNYEVCRYQHKTCPINEILIFHRTVMPCGSALSYAMRQIEKLDIECIAPQHGGIFTKKKDIDFMIQKLAHLDNVGIDGILAIPD